MVNELKMKWHDFCVQFNYALLDGCMDAGEKDKIKKKIEYHKTRLGASI